MLLKHVGDAPAAVEVAGGEDAAAGPVTPPDGTSSIREVAMYAQMMVVVFLIDSEKFSEAADCTFAGLSCPLSEPSRSLASELLPTLSLLALGKVGGVVDTVAVSLKRSDPRVPLLVG